MDSTQLRGLIYLPVIVTTTAKTPPVDARIYPHRPCRKEEVLIHRENVIARRGLHMKSESNSRRDDVGLRKTPLN